MSTAPKISIVVVIYKMSRQAENTLYSFSPEYQLGVDAADYEVIVMENESEDELGEERAEAFGPNFSYHRRPNTNSSPVPSLIEGVSLARGENLGIVIDGARMVTPRVLQYALAAFRINPHAMVNVPGYHLGSGEQHANHAHDAEVEQQLLDKVDWRTDGYRLFTISTFFHGRHQRGYLLPVMESNAMFCSRSDYELVGGADPRFDMVGGGMVNLDLYYEIGSREHVELFALPGEGTFHQFHGGVTTKPDDSRDDLLADFRAQYQRLRGHKFRMLERQPRLLGAVTGWAMPMMRFSAAQRMREYELAGLESW